MTDTITDASNRSIPGNITSPGSLTDIITGNFEQQPDAQEALAELFEAGYSNDQLTMFFIEPAASLDSTAAGADIGADAEIPAEASSIPSTIRKSGTLIAASAPTPEQQRRVVEILRAHGATAIECTEGSIIDGLWIDYDPKAPLQLIE